MFFAACYFYGIVLEFVGDNANLQFILLGVDPRIENVMVCVPREWHFLGIREVHIFSLWTATSLIALHFSCLWLILHNFIVLAHK